MQNNRRPRGRPPKLGEYHAFVLRLPEDLYKSLQDKALEAKVSLNDILVRIAREWLDAGGPPLERRESPHQHGADGEGAHGV